MFKTSNLEKISHAKKCMLSKQNGKTEKEFLDNKNQFIKITIN